MTTKAKIYLMVIVSVGWLALIKGVSSWQSHDLVNFVVFFCIALLASGLKVRMPGITGTISVCFFFVMIGIVSFSLPEVLLTGCSTVLVQYVWHSAKKLRLVQILFNVATVSIAITVSFETFHSAWLRTLPLEFSVLLAILACVYFVSNALPVAAVIALTEGQPLLKVLQDSYLWSFPYYLLAAATAGLFMIAKDHLGWQTSMLIVPVTYLVYRSYGLHVGRLEAEKKHAEETAALHFRTIESLALAIEAKDHTTHDHLQRVQVYAIEIGKELKLRDQELDALRAAALLHDIGKLAVPEHIISKPGKLTPEEFEKMKIHPVVGAEILERAQFPYPVVPIVRSHHEKWDGSGYPSGLKGEEIPIGARILSAVDCLDALASDRQYRRALPVDKAMETVAAEAGKAFDPKVVEILRKRYIELERLARGHPFEAFNLSTDIKIKNGLAPANGFESAGESETRSGSANSARLKSHVQAAQTELHLLLDTLPLLGNVLTVKETFSILSGRLAELIPFDSLAVYLRRGHRLAPEYVTGKEHELFASLCVPVGQGLSGWVAENNKPMINGNPSVESGYLSDPGKPSALRSALAVPLEGAQSVVGVLSLYRAESDAFTREQLRILLALGPALARTIEASIASHQTSPAHPTMIAPQAETSGAVLV